MTIDIYFRTKDTPSDGFKGKLINTIIQKWTKSGAYHCELVFEDLHLRALPGSGVEVTEVSNLPEGYLEGFDIKKTIKTPKMYREQKDIIRGFILDQNGAPYDWIGIILAQFLPMKHHDKDSWFCSELCAKIIQMTLSADYQEIAPHEMSPGDLLDLIESVQN